MTWSSTEVEKIATVVTKGTTPTTYGMSFVDKGVNFVKAEALNGDVALVESGFAFISSETHEKLKRSQLSGGDVLITIAGANVGRCGFVKDTNLPANTNQAVGVIRVDKELADPRFIYYHFKNPSTFNLCQSLGGQAAQPNINLTVLKNFQIKLPELSVQKVISSFLSSYDDLIENNNRRIQLLEESARLLYQEWFVHLRFPGHEHVEIVDGVPRTWKEMQLKDICFESKKIVKPDQMDVDTPYIGLEHIPRRSITLNIWETIEKVTSSKKAFLEGDILFGKIRPYFHKVGFVMCNGVTSSDAIVIRTHSQLLYFYCLLYLSSDYFVALASKTVREGSKMPRADWKYLLTTRLLVPDDDRLSGFNNEIEPIVRQLKSLSLQNMALVEARDLLLPRLMNGEISV